MGKCKKCGKSGLFLKLENGYCKDCIESIQNATEKLLRNHEKYMSDPFNQFCHENKEKAKYFENAIINNRITLKNKLPIDEQIKLHEENIKLYEELKSFCYSKGEGGKQYFERFFEHCHNSQSSNFSFIQKDIDALKKLKM